MDEQPEIEAIVVLIAAGNRAEASRLAEMLVASRLAACVQILPQIESVYHWQGAIHRDEESLLLVKTVRANFAALEREVRALHSYETPEIIALPVIKGSSPYLDWLGETIVES